MLVNEGLPLYLVSKIEENLNLRDKTVGILGMAFKGESDDIRSSLAYKLKKILLFKANRVLTSDPFVTVDDSLVSLEELLSESDIIVIGAPHNVYKNLNTSKKVVDIWNLLGQGNLI